MNNQSRKRKSPCEDSFEVSTRPDGPVKCEEMNPIQLSPEQRHVVLLAQQGVNLMILGGAGTGKSTLVSHIVDTLKTEGKEVRVSSMTGASALIIGGGTLHSTLAIGLGKLVNFEMARLRKSQAFGLFDTLIIDEISMMDEFLFQQIDLTCKVVRGKMDLPFGGAQLIVVGDFHQLRPVKSDTYMYDSKAFKEGQFHRIVLKTMQRSKTDPILMGIMERFRQQKVTRADCDMMNRKNDLISIKDRSIPHLYALGEDANAYNLKCLTRLKEKMHTFFSPDAKLTVTLCIGCRVMHLVNIPQQGLVNGSQGTVVAFSMIDNQFLPIVDFDGIGPLLVCYHAFDKNGGVKKSPKFLPLILSYGLTIHKAQGATFPKAVVFCKGIFCAGQAMTALSRTHSLDGMQVIGFELKHVKYDEKNVKFQRNQEDWLASNQDDHA